MIIFSLVLLVSVFGRLKSLSVLSVRKCWVLTVWDRPNWKHISRMFVQLIRIKIQYNLYKWVILESFCSFPYKPTSFNGEWGLKRFRNHFVYTKYTQYLAVVCITASKNAKFVKSNVWWTHNHFQSYCGSNQRHQIECNEFSTIYWTVWGTWD